MIRSGPKCHPHGITGYGDPSHGVIIVGIAPGSNEIKEGKPLVGPSGKLLDGVLKGIGWPRSKTYCTNLICWHKDEPDPTDIEGCKYRIYQELIDAKPHLLILLGRIVTETFIPSRKLGEVRGGVFWYPPYNCFVMATYHPAAVLRGQQPLIHDIVRDLAKIPDVMTWPKGPSQGDAPVQVISDTRYAQVVLNTLPSDRPIALDIETSYGEGDAEQIDVFSDRLISVAISDGVKTFAFNADVAQGLRWPLDNVQWAFHNGMFDAQGMRKYLNAPIPIVHDTMLMSYNLDERAGRHRLKTLAREYLGAGFYEEAVRVDALGTTDEAAVLEYNGKDAAYTARLATIFLKKMADDEVLAPYNNLLIPAANAFTEICLRGVHIDVKKVRELSIEWFPKYVEQNEALIEMAKEIGFTNPSAKPPTKPRSSRGVAKDEFDYASHADAINLSSPKQLSHLLYDVIGLPPPIKDRPRTTDKEALGMLEGEHPFIDALLKFRALDHMIGNYILGIEDDLRLDKRLHPQVLLHGTRTGRLSYREPPLQTIPQAYTTGDDLARVREIFAATNDDYVIVGADYEKAEVYSAAYLSGDQQMLADLQSADFHSTVAATVFNLPFNMVSQPQRQMAKKVTFGIFYGAGAAGLAILLKIAVNEAQKIIDNFTTRYHVYYKWFMRQRQTAIKEGELQGPTGRKRRFLLVMDHKALNQAVNAPVQTLASDICLSSLIELHRTLKPLDAHVLVSIHDAIYAEVPRKTLNEAVALMASTMSRSRFDGVPGIPVEVKVGRNLLHMEKVKVA